MAQAVPAFAAALETLRAGRLPQARAMVLDLVDRPNLTAACLHLLADIAFRQGERDRAIMLLRQALQLAPGEGILYENLAGALIQAGQIGGAIEIMLNRGAALQGAGFYAAAEPIFRRILELDPKCYAAQINLGHALAFLDRPADALTPLIRGLALRTREWPEIGRLLARLAPELGASGDVAAEAFQIGGPPNGPLGMLGGSLTSLGKALDETGHADAALAAHRLATWIEPSMPLAHVNLGLALLAHGRFHEGWPHYEWRLSGPIFENFRRLRPAPVWQGEPLTGKRLAVITEQGFGDTINFLPLIRRVSAMAAGVVLYAPPPLSRLLRHNLQDGLAGGSLSVAADDDPATEAAADYVIPLMSLPHRLDLAQQDLPLANAYLRPLPEDLLDWAERLADLGPLRVGLVWAGRRNTTDNAKRMLTPEALAPLLALADVDFVSLQIEDAPPERPGRPVFDARPLLKDFADTAAAIAQLDLVITIDTGVAHLAAAMGRPVWIMLRYHADWRWFDDRARSRWYPSARLFRQPRAGDWTSVVAEVCAALEAWKASGN